MLTIFVIWVVLFIIALLSLICLLHNDTPVAIISLKISTLLWMGFGIFGIGIVIIKFFWKELG